MSSTRVDRGAPWRVLPRVAAPGSAVL